MQAADFGLALVFRPWPMASLFCSSLFIYLSPVFCSAPNTRSSVAGSL